MSRIKDRFSRTMLMLLPTMLVVVGCAVSLLPESIVVHTLSLLTTWLYLSIPIGIAVGHCALSESDCP
jgi:hypothetical protein